MPASTDLLTEADLLAQITFFEKKLQGLTKAGPGAGMAAAATAVRLRRLQDEARSRSIEL